MQKKNPLEKLLARLNSVLANSPMAKSLSLLLTTDDRFKTGRPLSEAEIKTLISQHNVCENWSRVRLLSAMGLDRIHHNHFSGDILFSGFQKFISDANGEDWTPGLSYARLQNCIIGNACITQVAQIQNQVIEDDVILLNVGSVISNQENLFSLGQGIHPGAETGERTCWIWDELTLSDCEDALGLNQNEQKVFSLSLNTKIRSLQSRFGIISKGSRVLHTRRIENSWIGPYTIINGASLITDSAIISRQNASAQILSDAWIEASLIQPGCKVDSGGKVSYSVLLSEIETSGNATSQKNVTASPSLEGAASITLGGTVSHSVIGPATQVSKGEITASLVGPSVGFHHQALLISALWPEGRGNVAYGANVGSNHTGKKPDQEIRPGEGMFFGLGCTIKFPTNLTDAPYSLIAAGLITQPQKVTFPFSLMSQSQHENAGLSLTLNEITPGWMWSSNAYSLFRRGYKTVGTGSIFSSRIFNLSLAQKVFSALQALLAAIPQSEPYLEKNISGLGHNFLSVVNLSRGVESYRDYLFFFLMQEYGQSDTTFKTENKNEKTDRETFLTDVFKSVSGKEIFTATALKSFLNTEKNRFALLKEKVIASLDRDQKRGQAVFSDYQDFHQESALDSIVLRLEMDLKILKQRLEHFLQTT